MQISVESTGTLGRRLTVAVPADRVEQAFAKRLQRLSRQVKVPGFRPGKTPMKVIEARFGEQVLHEVTGELIETTFREAIGQQGLNPVAGPVIERKSFARGEEFAYTAEFEVFPEIPKPNLIGETVERPTCSITPEDIERSLQSLRRQRTVWEPVQREAKDGDRLLIDFKGAIEGQAFEGGEATGYQLVLGTGGSMVDGFEAGLAGAKAGESRTLNLEFSKQHPKPELAGKPVVFEVVVQEVAESRLPEVSEDFVRQLGVDDGKIETLNERVRSNLEREMKQRLRALVRTRVLEALVAANKFDLPQGLLKAEMDYVRRLHHALRGQQAPSAPETAEESAAYERTARNRLMRGLILAEVIRVNAIKPSPERVRARVTELSEEYQSPEEFVRACYANRKRMDELEAAVVDEQAIAHLLDTAEVTEKPITFQELVQLVSATG